MALGERFTRVVATDASAKQIASAEPHPRVTYAVAPAEEPPAGGPFDLVTVAQALHWLDLPRFWAAVRAAARPGALFCAFSYGNVATDEPAVNAILVPFDARLHAEGWWPPERRLVDEGYASIAIPFAPMAAPPFPMEASWNARALLAYVETWSAVTRLREAGRAGVVDAFREALLAAWGDPAAARTVSWPLAIRAGRV